MKASTLSFRLAILMVIAGMAWGITMAASGDHSTMPAHAHLNLLGWVSLFLFGVFYRLHPALERSRVAIVQVVVWALGTVALAIGVGMIHSGIAAAEPLAGIASIVLLAGIFTFAWLAFRAERTGIRVQPGQNAAMTPAE